MSEEEIASWLAGRLPAEWFDGAPEVTVDRDEVVVVGRIAVPADAEDKAVAQKSAAEAGRIARFREDTREQRIRIAREAEQKFDRKFAWGAVCGDTRQVFTTLSVPVMTRLRQAERHVLDTLVDAGVARSRSHALAWCVRLVGQHSEQWLGQLREAMQEVQRVREAGPESAA